MKVFLLEDDSEVAASMIGALEMRGHEVVWVESLSEARAELGSEQTFDLGIIDLNVRHAPGGLNNAKGTDILPVDFKACVYSGLPEDAKRELKTKGVEVPVFSKGDPFALLDWIEES